MNLKEQYSGNGQTTKQRVVATPEEMKRWTPGPTAVDRLITDPENRTDLANARRFVDSYGEQVRYCHPWRKWLVWEGTHWQLDETGAVVRLGKAIADSVWDEARFHDDKRALQFAAKTASNQHVKDMLALAASDVAITPAELDSNDWLLNCANGTVDLRTGELRAHRREDYITKLCPTNYDPKAETYAWDKFLEDVFGEQPLIEFMQRALGYSLTGDVREQILTIFWGVGANGKSTLLEAFMNAVGRDYTMKAPPDLLIAKRNDTHPTERADLFGKRFVVCTESAEAGRLNESLVKELTGGDSIRARRMREDFWQFRPTHKLILCTNHKPRVKGTDHAIWRRLRLVPFVEVFDGPRQDKQLPERLQGERDGILAWAVGGCLEWQKSGLGEPEAVKAATAEYRTSQDSIGEFLADCCELDPQQWTSNADLRSTYEAWCRERGDKPCGWAKLADALEQRDCEKRRRHPGRGWDGIGITNRDNVTL